MLHVVGLAFCPHLREVVLVEKRHPRWGTSHLAGPGGKVGGGETLVRAMVRVFAKETGILTCEGEWSRFAIIEDGEGKLLHFFYLVFVGCMPSSIIAPGEDMLVTSVAPCSRWVPNLRWLVPMALNCARGEGGVEYFQISEYPKMLGVGAR